jgi:hypothetical protein
MREMGIPREISGGKLDGRRRCREDVNKINLKGIGLKAVNWILVAQDRD